MQSRQIEVFKLLWYPAAQTVVAQPRSVRLSMSPNSTGMLPVRSLFDFNFESSLLADGTPRVIGESPDGFAFLELIGPEQDITKATMMVAMPSDDPGIITLNSAYMLGLLSQVTPNWDEGPGWLADNFAVAAEKGEAQTTWGHVEVSLTALTELGMVLLTVERRSGIGEQGVSDFTRQVEAEIAELRSEYEDWRAEESRKYEAEIDASKSEIERLRSVAVTEIEELRDEVGAIREIAITDSVSAAKSEWIEAEQLAAQVIATVDRFDGEVDAALAGCGKTLVHGVSEALLG